MKKTIFTLIAILATVILIGIAVLKNPPYPIPQFNEQQLEQIQNEEGLK